MRIDSNGVDPIIKEQSFYEMLELRKALFLWAPLTVALYCSAARLSTDLNALSNHELLLSPTVTTHAMAYQEEGRAAGIESIGF